MSWNDNFITGIKDIDEQHRWLIDLINNAAPVLALDYERNHLRAESLLDQLTDYAVFHFETEDRLMREYRIDPRHHGGHLETHGAFAAAVAALRADYRDGKPHSGGELLSFLANWLVYHILGEDQALARQMRAIDAGMSPAEAYDSAEGARRDPTHEALTQALIDLYKLMTEQNRNLLEINHELEAHRHRLEDLVSARTADLAHALDAAQSANRARNAFIANMSHEIRTPMNAISGLTWAMRRNITDPEQLARLQKVGEATQQLLGIINDLLDMARIESDALLLEPLDFSPGALIDEVVSGIAAGAAAKRLSIQRETAGLPALLRGDPVRIGQILGNFASNALKFTEHGQIMFRAREVAPHDACCRIRFEIEDTGSGFDTADLPRLFSPFEQGDGSSTRKHGGTGLGLAISRRLADMMDGAIGAESTPGKGSLFWFEVPLQRVNGRPVAPGNVAPGASGQASGIARPTERNLERQRETLRRLAELLAEDDVRAVSLWHESAQILRGTLDGHAAPFESALDAYDFAAAHALLSEAVATLSDTA